MRQTVVLALFLCLIAAVNGRGLRNLGPGAIRSYATIADALADLNATNLATLGAAIRAANVPTRADAKWTIVVPIDGAFESEEVQGLTGLTADQLLAPAHKQQLIQLLSYHVVPSGAFTSKQLKNGQKLTTLLANAPALNVFVGDDPQTGLPVVKVDNATVTGADVVVGGSIAHVIDKVLVPPVLVAAKGSP